MEICLVLAVSLMPCFNWWVKKSVYLGKMVLEDEKLDSEVAVYYRIQDNQNQNDVLALTRWRAKC